MNRGAKNQWDFGELFPKEELRRVWSVAEITGNIRRLLETQIGRVWVGGEVSNLRVQSSGHAYFTLKDAAAQLSCVLFRGEARATRELLEDGRRVVLHGELTVYEPRGQYQLRVEEIELQGVGALQLAFEKLKQKLKAEGLFDPARKRPLPRFPRRIGVVTSPTGAALRDVLHVIGRRQPGLEIILAPCRVQGDGAAAEIAAALGLLNEFHRARKDAGEAGLDLILVTRGGGSLEDLWAFNEEIVARAIFESLPPVVSAVGHEIDFTIADFVADVRAATPSAAAELITEGAFASRQQLADVIEGMRQRVRARWEIGEAAIRNLRSRLERLHPRRPLQDKSQRVDELLSALQREADRSRRDRVLAWRNLLGRLAQVRPRRVLTRRREQWFQICHRLREASRARWRETRANFATLAGRTELLSPQSTLRRGYSLTLDAASGRLVRQAGAVRAGQILETRLAGGRLWSAACEPPTPAVASSAPPPSVASEKSGRKRNST